MLSIFKLLKYFVIIHKTIQTTGLLRVSDRKAP